MIEAGCAADGGQQRKLRHLHRDVVVLRVIAKRPAMPQQELSISGWLGVGISPSSESVRGHFTKRFLVAMAVHEDRARWRV